MIYEMRTYDIKPRSLPEVEKRFGEAYEKRKKYSELGALVCRNRLRVWPPVCRGADRLGA